MTKTAHTKTFSRVHGKKGYALHDRRIAHSGGTGSMRTIKYELTHSDTSILQTAAKAVHHDNLRLYGVTTFDDYLLGDRTQPNIIDFWLEALSLGAVFAYAAGEPLKAMLDSIQGRKSLFEQLFDAMPYSLREQFNQEKWTSFFMRPKRKLNEKSEADLQRQFLNTLRKPDEADNTLKELAARYAKGIGTIPYGEAQIIFACNIFGINYQAISNTSQTKDTGGKLTFVLLPDSHYTPFNTDGLSRTQIFEYVEDRLAQKLNDPNKVKEAMGIGSNGNALGNFLGAAFNMLHDGHIEPILATMQNIVQYDTTSQQSVKQRLAKLAKTARQIGKPKIMSSWSDYRSDLNGSLESFVSNRGNHHEALRLKLSELADELNEIIPKIATIDSGAEGQQLTELLDKLLDLSKRAQTMRLGNDDYEVLRLLQSDARLQLNYWLQAHQDELKEGQKGKKKNDPLTIKQFAPKLSSELQRISLFFGDAQRAKFEKAINAKRIFREQANLLGQLIAELLPSADPEMPITAKDAEAFRRFASKTSSTWGNITAEVLARAMGVQTLQLKEREAFFVSSFAKAKYTQVPYEPVPLHTLLKAKDWINEWHQLTADTHDLATVLDAIELYKTLIAILCRASTRESFSVRQSQFTPKQQAYLDASENILTPAALNFFAQTLVCAEMRGLIAIMSRTSFVARSAIQATNGTQATLVVCSPTTQDTFTPVGNEQFKLALKHSTESTEWPTHCWQIGKSDNKTRLNIQPVKKPYGILLYIRSSKYQLQFLRWFLKKPKTKHCELSMQGSFTINERTVSLDWSGETPRCTVTRNRLFASIPFTLLPPKETKPATRSTHERYLGIDIGEYGLAWHVIEVDGTVVKPIAKGIIQTSEQQCLKVAVNDLKSQQRKGTFGMPSTYIERLRKSLVGNFRNQIHALSMRYGAIIVFEYNVSAFETGGARIKKVYDSVKRSDTWSNQTDETKMLHRQAWGNVTGKGFITAKEVSAGGTSQTCTKCKRWFSRHIANELETINDSLPLNPVPGYKHLYEVAVGNHTLKLFSKAGGTITKDNLGKAVYEFMRPPEDSEARAFARTHEHGFAAKALRGNSAVFICPFSDCHHVADADIQAAFTIALRGCIAVRNNDNKKEGETLPFYELSQDYTYPPVTA